MQQEELQSASVAVALSGTPIVPYQASQCLVLIGQSLCLALSFYLPLYMSTFQCSTSFKNQQGQKRLVLIDQFLCPILIFSSPILHIIYKKKKKDIQNFKISIEFYLNCKSQQDQKVWKVVRSGKNLNDLSWAALWPLNELLCRPIKTRRICVCIAVCISVRAVCIPVCIRSSTHHKRCSASSGGASGSRIVGPAQLPEQQHTRTKIPGGATTIHQHQKF